MPSLKDVQKVVPGAETVAGRVIAFHNGQHVDLGEYVGDGAVVLSKAGEEVLSPAKNPEKPGRKLAPNINTKLKQESPGLDLSTLS